MDSDDVMMSHGEVWGKWLEENQMKFGAPQSTCSSSSSDSSDSDVMGGPKSSENLELPVWVEGKEKWVTGLTRRTTCDDVMYALLLQVCDVQYADVKDYVLHERWRGMERPLRGRTKILKVWRAWGAENHNVVFTMRPIDSGLDTSCEVTKTKKVRRPKHSHQKSTVPDGKRHKSSTNNKKDNKKGETESTDDTRRKNEKAKAFHELVHTVLDQEKEAHDQMRRIQDMDVQIDTIETKVHLSRIEQNGKNYVQEAYLKDRGEESGSSGTEEGAVGGARGKCKSRDRHSDTIAYLELRSSVLDIEEKLEAKQCKIAELASLIQEESILSPDSISEQTGKLDHKTEAEVLQRLWDEVNRCLRVSEEQTEYMKQVESTITECEAQLRGKQDYMRCLESELEGEDKESVEGFCDEGFHQDFISSGPALRNSAGLCMSEEQDQKPVSGLHMDSERGLMLSYEESGHFIRDVPYAHSQLYEPLETIPENIEYEGVEFTHNQISPYVTISDPVQDERIQKLKFRFMKSSNSDKDGLLDKLNFKDCSINDSTISLPPSIPSSPCDQGFNTNSEHIPCYAERTLYGYKPYITYTNYTCCRGPSSDSDSTDTGVGSLGSNEDGVLETLV